MVMDLVIVVEVACRKTRMVDEQPWVFRERKRERAWHLDDHDNHEDSRKRPDQQRRLLRERVREPP